MKTLRPRAFPSRLAISIATIVLLLILPIANVPAVHSSPLASAVTIPNKVGFEGYLTDGTGQPIGDGAHSLAFRVYSLPTDPPASALWVETQTITVTTGLYSALLGSFQVLTTNLFNGDRWIGVTVDGGNQITPTTRVASVPFALNAEHANSAENAAGVPWSGITGMPSVVTGSATNRQVALWGSGNTLTGSSGLTSASGTLTTTGGLNVGSASGAAAGEVRASAFASQQLPFVTYDTLPAGAGGMGISANAIPFAVSIYRTGTINEWDQIVYIKTTNNSTNYWTITLNRGDTGAVLTSFNTSATAANTLVRNSLSLSISITTGMGGLYIAVAKTGSPGPLYLYGPAVFEQ